MFFFKAILFVLILVFDLKSPVHPFSESRKGTLSVTYERTDGRSTEILVYNIVTDWFGFQALLCWIVVANKSSVESQIR